MQAVEGAYRFRWLFLIAAVLCLVAGLWWLGSPLVVDGDGDDGTERIIPTLFLPTAFLGGFRDLDSKLAYGVYLTIFLGTLLLTQWMFLRPRRGWKVRMAETSRPMKTAVAAAAFMAMMLSFGLMATMLELLQPEVWEGAIEDGWMVGIVTILWILWAITFYIYWRGGDRFAQLRTMIKGLIVGSVLELFVAIGVYVWNPHEEDCWCARGSYTGLVFGATVMIWAFGPGLLLLFLREKQRREAPMNHV